MLRFALGSSTRLFDLTDEEVMHILAPYEDIYVLDGSDSASPPTPYVFWHISNQPFYDLDAAFEAWWGLQNFSVPFSENPMVSLVINETPKEYTLSLENV